MNNQGQIHVYTGNGKGKTTAAFGLALRALGRSKQVAIAQFLKNQPTGELLALQKFIPLVCIKQFGTGLFIKNNNPTKDDIALAKDGLQFIECALKDPKNELIILDEICDVIGFNIIKVNELLTILKTKHSHQELVLTGRCNSQEILNFATLITEMNPIKHYFSKGVPARNGIEF